MTNDTNLIVYVGMEGRLRDRLAMVAKSQKVSMREVIRRALDAYKRECEIMEAVGERP